MSAILSTTGVCTEQKLFLLLIRQIFFCDKLTSKKIVSPLLIAVGCFRSLNFSTQDGKNLRNGEKRIFKVNQLLTYIRRLIKVISSCLKLNVKLHFRAHLAHLIPYEKGSSFLPT